MSKQQQRRRDEKQIAVAFLILQYGPIALALVSWAIAAIEFSL